MVRDKSSKERQRKILEEFSKKIGAEESRKIRARGKRSKNYWFWLGMFGLVGWSVVIPTLIGIAIGIWIDKTYPSQFSWTLMLLFVGVILGCLNAWYWVKRESGNE